MLGWILNTPLVKVVRTQIWTLFSFKIKEIESVLTNKQRIAKKKIALITSHLKYFRKSFETCFAHITVFVYFGDFPLSRILK